MKIGILTLPLVDNYGGILQAYALQRSRTVAPYGERLINEFLELRSECFACALPTSRQSRAYGLRTNQKIQNTSDGYCGSCVGFISSSDVDASMRSEL